MTPERIWVWHDDFEPFFIASSNELQSAGDSVTYIRKDVHEAELSRCRAETLREAEKRVEEIEDYPDGYIGHADAMDEIYLQVRDLLDQMADEAEANDE